MINLIPNEEKKKMARDFYYRLIVLFFIMLGLCAGIAVVAIVPSYLLSEVKEREGNSRLEAQKKEPVPILDQVTLEAIKALDSKINLIDTAEKNKFLLSEKIINEIVKSKMPEIKITKISYERLPLPIGVKVGISGTAPSREMLRLFRESLEGNSSFKNVDLPISNFIRGSNIQFYLTLSPA